MLHPLIENGFSTPSTHPRKLTKPPFLFVEAGRVIYSNSVRFTPTQLGQPLGPLLQSSLPGELRAPARLRTRAFSLR